MRVRFTRALKQQKLILNDPPMKIDNFGMSRDVQTPLRRLRKQVLTDSICISWKLMVLEGLLGALAGKWQGGGGGREIQSPVQVTKTYIYIYIYTYTNSARNQTHKQAYNIDKRQKNK